MGEYAGYDQSLPIFPNEEVRYFSATFLPHRSLPPSSTEAGSLGVDEIDTRVSDEGLRDDLWLQFRALQVGRDYTIHPYVDDEGRFIGSICYNLDRITHEDH